MFCFVVGTVHSVVQSVKAILSGLRVLHTSIDNHKISTINLEHLAAYEISDCTNFAFRHDQYNNSFSHKYRIEALKLNV